MPRLHRIFMLAFPDCQILDVAGPMQMFAGANSELGRQAYDLAIVAPASGAFRTSSGTRLVADLAFSDLVAETLREGDPIVVAGGDGGLKAVEALGEITTFVRAAGLTEARIVSICSGAFSSPRPVCWTGCGRRPIGARWRNCAGISP